MDNNILYKVSIIIPAYNVEKYISKCIKSIMTQTEKNIEIIVVNDGSKDNTLLKIQQLSEQDERIKIIDKENQGVSKARNDGLKVALGEYVLFVDGDDYIEPDTIECLYKNVKDNNSDVVCYDYFFTYENGKNIEQKDIEFDFISGDEFLKLCLDSKMTLTLWNKLIKREILINNNIMCLENSSFGEDMAASINLACHVNNASKVTKCLYHYVQRDTSITKMDSIKLLDIIDSINSIEKDLIDNNKYEKFKDEFDILKFYHLYYYNVVTSNVIGEFHRKLYLNWKNN